MCDSKTLSILTGREWSGQDLTHTLITSPKNAIKLGILNLIIGMKLYERNATLKDLLSIPKAYNLVMISAVTRLSVTRTVAKWVQGVDWG